jgi:hypothetical protein
MITRTNLLGTAGASFSNCERYRYLLWRVWRLPTSHWLNMVMLNPSTADAWQNDPTVTRCERRAREAGFDGLYVTNIFGWRATNPYDLYKLDDPVGPENDLTLVETAALSQLVVCAWGNHGQLRGRSAKVQELLTGIPLTALRVSKLTGEPYHPLYLSYDLQPAPFGGKS